MPSPERHYQKAPITEAVIDLRVELPPTLSIADLVKAHASEEATYPTATQMNVGHMTISAHISVPDPQVSTSSQHMGFLYRSADGNQTYQVRKDGFTMSRQTPYQNWKDFRTEARRLWAIYRSVAQPLKVVRVAVRYINRIDIPVPLNDFGDYLRTVPQVAPDLPQGLSNYFMQLVVPFEGIKSFAILNEALIDPARPDVVSVVLDIDIFRTVDLPEDDEGLWAILDELRIAKNKVFEACITDKARELFQ